MLQNSQMRADEESKTMSSELASAINDSLYFYEQVDIFISCAHTKRKNNIVNHHSVCRN